MPQAAPEPEEQDVPGPEEESPESETEHEESPDDTEEPEEGAEEPDGGSDETPEAPQPEATAKPRSRTAIEMDRLRKRAQATEAELARLRAEAQAERQARLGITTAQQEAAERERIALMTDSERAEHFRQKDREYYQREIQQLRFETTDTADRARFDALCASNRLYAEVAEEVEEALASARRNGQPGASREMVAKYLIGDRVAKRAASARTKQANAGAKNIARQTARPTAPRSDVRGGSEGKMSDRAARARRLDGVQI